MEKLGRDLQLECVYLWSCESLFWYVLVVASPQSSSFSFRFHDAFFPFVVLYFSWFPKSIQSSVVVAASVPKDPKGNAYSILQFLSTFYNLRASAYVCFCLSGIYNGLAGHLHLAASVPLRRGYSDTVCGVGFAV